MRKAGHLIRGIGQVLGLLAGVAALVAAASYSL